MIPNRISIHCKNKTSLTLLHFHLQIKLQLDKENKGFSNLDAKTLNWNTMTKPKKNEKPKKSGVATPTNPIGPYKRMLKN